MANLCDGNAFNAQKQLKNSKAYCEGAEYRFGGTAVERPVTDNPHEISEASASWAAGWVDADSGTVEGCCASPNRVAPV